MEKTLYIIVYRDSPESLWQERVGCVFADERLADNMLEIKRSQDVTGQYAKVSGIPFMPETEAEAEARLGAFK